MGRTASLAKTALTAFRVALEGGYHLEALAEVYRWRRRRFQRRSIELSL